MHQAFTCVLLMQNNKMSPLLCRTTLSLFVSTPALADCFKTGDNENGGINITCEGYSSFSPALVQDTQYNNVIVQGDVVNSSYFIFGGYSQVDGTVTDNTVTINDGSNGKEK
ncbi:hypothetical protein ACSTMU_003857 [Morganella morganii]|uniref:hypothetical protein n=1 Tax=Morganella morganii TaxID=582 RepID=UPI001BDA1836|nr:hypothetical protein [Morganella morganii]MBT0318422.1 hypothetical protein [Morganella morganii subsp. morganii]